jgi:rsbT co-antagonist protein RsbR
MSKNSSTRIAEILEKYEAELLADWVKEQLAAITLRPDLLKESELREQSAEFLNLFRDAAQSGNLTDIEATEAFPRK